MKGIQLREMTRKKVSFTYKCLKRETLSSIFFLYILYNLDHFIIINSVLLHDSKPDPKERPNQTKTTLLIFHSLYPAAYMIITHLKHHLISGICNQIVDLETNRRSKDTLTPRHVRSISNPNDRRLNYVLLLLAFITFVREGGRCDSILVRFFSSSRRVDIRRCRSSLGS